MAEIANLKIYFLLRNIPGIARRLDGLGVKNMLMVRQGLGDLFTATGMHIHLAAIIHLQYRML